MILDANGREFRRKIGFEGGLVGETKGKNHGTTDTVSWASIAVDETEGAEAETDGE